MRKLNRTAKQAFYAARNRRGDVTRLAESTGYSASHVSNVLAGRRSVPQDLANEIGAELQEKFGSNNLQVVYDIENPYKNVIGFLIRLSNIKMLIKSALEGGTQAPNTNDTLPEEV